MHKNPKSWSGYVLEFDAIILIKLLHSIHQNNKIPQQNLKILLVIIIFRKYKGGLKRKLNLGNFKAKAKQKKLKFQGLKKIPFHTTEVANSS